MQLRLLSTHSKGEKTLVAGEHDSRFSCWWLFDGHLRSNRDFLPILIPDLIHAISVFSDDIPLSCVLERIVLVSQSCIEYLGRVLYILIWVSPLDFIMLIKSALHLLSHMDVIDEGVIHATQLALLAFIPSRANREEACSSLKLWIILPVVIIILYVGVSTWYFLFWSHIELRGFIHNSMGTCHSIWVFLILLLELCLRLLVLYKGRNCGVIHFTDTLSLIWLASCCPTRHSLSNFIVKDCSWCHSKGCLRA